MVRTAVCARRSDRRPWRTPARDGGPSIVSSALPRIASVAYVAGLVVTSGEATRPGAWLFTAAAALLLVAAVRAQAVEARAVAWGGAVVVASLGAASGVHRALDGAAALGELACLVAACVAVARLRTEGEAVVRVGPGSPVAPVVGVAAAWSASLFADVAPGGRGLDWLEHRPVTWFWCAVIASAVALAGSLARTAHRGRLDLAIRERVGAIRWMSATLLATSVAVGSLASGSSISTARFALAAVAGVFVWAAVNRDAVRVRAVARRATVLALFGGGVALVATAAVEGRTGPGSGSWVIVSAALSLLAIGSAAGRLERPFRPAGGAWLDAFACATEAAALGEPHEVLRHALLALRAPLGLEFPSPALWIAVPPREIRVDAAGYLHEATAELPPALAAVAANEPGATLRSELLDAVQVRRPELRPLAAWMRDRGALVATRVECAGEMEGVLVLPRGNRRDPVTLEEVRRLKGLADWLGAACRARATELRLLERANAARALTDRAEQRADRLEHDHELDGRRNRLAASLLARAAGTGVYAAASRMAIEALERRAQLGAPLALVAPLGVDPVPYIARAHLSGARRDAPLVLVDATAARERDAARWCDPGESPLALAHGGRLVLLDGAALPATVQAIIARTLAEARVPWERPDRLDVQLALTGVVPPAEAVSQGRLEPALAARLGDALSTPIVLPRMHERPEDFRGLLMDRLAREGLRLRGEPVGIEPAAYARLAECAFPGDETELSALVQRLVARCQGDRVLVADLDALRVPRRGPGPPGVVRESRRRKDPLSA